MDGKGECACEGKKEGKGRENRSLPSFSQSGAAPVDKFFSPSVWWSNMVKAVFASRPGNR